MAYPTAWGRIDGGDIIEEELDDCTCQETCPWNCKGECGCKSCQDAWEDFLSME